MSKVYYLDDNNNIVPKEEATHFFASRHDKNGNFIENFGFFDHENKIDPSLKKLADEIDWSKKISELDEDDIDLKK